MICQRTVGHIFVCMVHRPTPYTVYTPTPHPVNSVYLGSDLRGNGEGCRGAGCRPHGGQVLDSTAQTLAATQIVDLPTLQG